MYFIYLFIYLFRRRLKTEVPSLYDLICWLGIKIKHNNIDLCVYLFIYLFIYFGISFLYSCLMLTYLVDLRVTFELASQHLQYHNALCSKKID